MANINDPIADLLTRIRNAQMAGLAVVKAPASKITFEIAKILASKGYVEYANRLDEGPQGTLEIGLKYDRYNKGVITNLKRVSKSSRRVYVGVDNIPQVLNGLGIAILSTSKGVMAGNDAAAANVGGEVLCTIY